MPAGGIGSTPSQPQVVSADVSGSFPLDPYVSIVLPCYNEQDHVVAEVERICEAMDASGYAYELVAYDDASTDGTFARLHEVAPYGPAREVLALRTREDARLRTAPPLKTKPRPIAVWMTEPER